MALYIYNSLSGRKEEFKPIKKNRVNMYVCGPTVYDESHIGHARGAFVFDVVRKYLTYKKFKVKYVRNITDIDDKIIGKARNETGGIGDLKITITGIAKKYLKKYNDDMESLGIGRPDAEPKATEHIKDMINVINALLRKKSAYESGGDIYFRVRSFKDYGKLSRQSIKMLESGARIASGEGKEDPLDFALWKKSREGEPTWECGSFSGRPGWHIECSAMSMRHLGENFDIHGGGIDLIFPHHENEIAQSESYSGKRFANYWMHNGLLTINGQKMAKSLSNYMSISDFLNRYNDPDLLKIFLLSTHYRSPVDFTADNITAAKAAKDRFNVFFNRVDGISRSETCGKPIREYTAILETLKSGFEKAMDDDFNTAIALAVLFEAITKGNSIIDDQGEINTKIRFLKALSQTIRQMGAILGLSFSKRGVSAGLKEMIEGRIRERDNARKNKDYRLADRIRKELLSRGVVLEDAKDGTKWRIK